MKLKIICRDENYAKYQHMLEKAGFSVSDDANLLFKEIDFQQEYLIGFNTKGEKRIINYDDFYLIESFAHDIIVHTSFGEYKIKERLFEVEGIFENRDIIRINKSQIIPKEKIMKIIPQYNSKLKILLKNKITVYVSRMYLMSFRKKIGM